MAAWSFWIAVELRRSVYRELDRDFEFFFDAALGLIACWGIHPIPLKWINSRLIATRQRSCSASHWQSSMATFLFSIRRKLTVLAL